MINTYGEQTNPCTFCIEDNENTTTDKEYLELSLCGNDTTLIVREVSVEDLKKPKEDGLPTEEALQSESPREASLKVTSVASKPKLSPDDLENSNSRRLDALYTKKWSGNTYFEEEIRRLREQQYHTDLKHTVKMRKLWHQFQKELLKDRRRDLVKSSGPEWWQEPSTKQIVLATTLKDVIKADYEEEVTGRTRQWLLDLGVTTRLTPKQIRMCMKRSLLEPVDFLLEAHVLVVKFQLNLKKKGDLQRPFTVDERLLLTAVCVLQLPTLLTMLHYILPPPKPYSADKHIQELLYGNLNDETIRYSTPYMEPLPFRNKMDFEDWAFGKICSALLPILLKDDRGSPNVRKSVLSGNITLDLKRSLSLVSETHSLNDPYIRNVSIHSAVPSIALLLSYCLSKRGKTDSLKVNVDVDEVSQPQRTFGRRLTLRAKQPSREKPTEPHKSDYTENPVLLRDKSLETETIPATRDTTPSAIKKENTIQSTAQEYSEDKTWSSQLWQGESTQPIPGKDNVYPYSVPSFSAPTYSVPQCYENVYVQQDDYPDNPVILKPSQEDRKALHTMRTNDIDYSKTSSKMTMDGTQPDIEDMMKTSYDEEEGDGSRNQLENVWEEIEACPEKEQLQKALKVLMEMGDPLAQLPKIEKLPTIQRWLELRRGKNRILSKETKGELLNRTRGMWKSVHNSSITRGPKVNISKREERKLTWDKKKWLESEVKKEKDNYFARIKQEKVDNARSFFPTMLNHYDYGSKLNRNFRDVFYTYLPSREADTFAYRPWQPQETRNSKS